MSALRKAKAEPAKSTWRDRVSALRYLWPLMCLVWETEWRLTSAMLILRLIRAFIPLASLYVGKLIIDNVVAAINHKTDWQQIFQLVIIEFSIVIFGDILARISSLVESLLGDLFSNHTSIKLMQHAATLDLYQFEEPTFYDRLERARRQSTGRLGLLITLFSIVQDLITMVSLAAALLVYSTWLLVLLTIAIIPSLLGETHFAALEYSLLFKWTPERRKLDYLRYLGASDRTAKEVQVFGLAPWVIDRFRTLSDKFYLENRGLAIKRSIVAALLAILGNAGYYTAYVIILFRTVSGVLSIGTLTFLAAAFSRSRDLIQRLLLSASGIYEQSLYLKDLFEFFNTQPTIFSKPNAIAVPINIKEGIIFENVSFRYPDSEHWAIRNLNLHIRPGERIALVGENGAGKTTLTKLLTRLYDATEGRILLDGIDLREYDLSTVRKAVGVIFQDFVRYDLRFDENIGLGNIELVNNYLNEITSNGENGNGVVPPDKLVVAAKKSLASSLLKKLPQGYQQMLGRRFEGGVELSGGEWQKVGLARAYMRDAQMIILDEPTAALDARAEYDVFLRFAELVSGKMAIIISHRFSTVRMADRIIVLQQGEIIESGSHDQLVKMDGVYAELFKLQAEGYR